MFWWHCCPCRALVRLSRPCRASLEMRVLRANYQAFISQAMNGIVGKLIDFEWTGGKIVPQDLIDILCDDSTGCKEAGDNDDFQQKQTQ